MRYLIKDCTIYNAGSIHHLKKYDILIQKGKIERIAKSIRDDKAEVIKGKSLGISIGWMDIGTHLGEPGHEQRETIASLCRAALAGGFTELAVFPNTVPPVETAAQVRTIAASGKPYGVNIYPIAALSKSTKGKELTEFLDLDKAGAIAFSDGNLPVTTSGLLLRALQYAIPTRKTIIHHPTDPSINNENMLHEGEVSITMGLKGSPEMSESMAVNRDLVLQDYAGGRLCLHNISSAESVKLLKKRNENVYASVAFANIIFTDQDVEGYNVNYKVDPPLRSASDQRAIIAGLKKGTIDCITSNHTPLEEELKKVEYPYATHGMIGLQTCFSALVTSGKLDIDLIVDKLTTGPRKILGLPVDVIEEGLKSTFTIFDSEVAWTYNVENKASLSHNSPLLGNTLKGKVVRTIS